MAGPVALAIATARRDIALAFKGGGGWLHGVVFYAVFVSLSAFALGPSAEALRPAGPAIVWLAGLFAVQLTVSDMFVPDLDDGTMGVLVVETWGLLPYVAGKATAVFVVTGLPLLAAAPIVFAMFATPPATALAALPALTLGALALILAAVVASAINAALRGGGRFTAILAAPLSIPVLIFGLGATRDALEAGDIWTPDFMLLAAVSAFLAAVAPGFAALSLRLGLE